jgi:hypothetical protein
MSNPDILVACTLLVIFVVVEIITRNLLDIDNWGWIGTLARALLFGVIFVILHFIIKYW